jgi:large subunit ribosomal protein L9
MRVILLQDLRHQGERGTIIDVKPGYARNFLMPQGIAMLASEGNVKHFEQLRKKFDEKHVKAQGEAEAAAAELDGLVVTVKKRVDENGTLYGSVTATEVAEGLEAQGVEVDRRRIDLEGGIKSLGDHPVRVEYHADVRAEFTVRVEVEE